MNLKEIKEMIQLMNENNLTEFELEKDGLKIRLRKNSGGGIEQTIAYENAPVSRVHAEPAAKEPAKPVPSANKATIKSPMVGTFYASPAPDAPPFVTPGSQIEVGQVICIIEAMKLMNEIKSEVRGKIAEIPVHNGDPVEFGQPLFVLE